MTGDERKKEMEECLKHIQITKEVTEMSMKEMAMMMFNYYKALHESGFTEEQAFEIIKFRGLK